MLMMWFYFSPNYINKFKHSPEVSFFWLWWRFSNLMVLLCVSVCVLSGVVLTVIWASRCPVRLSARILRLLWAERAPSSARRVSPPPQPHRHWLWWGHKSHTQKEESFLTLLEIFFLPVCVFASCSCWMNVTSSRWRRLKPLAAATWLLQASHLTDRWVLLLPTWP